jgi:hypothetical protein
MYIYMYSHMNVQTQICRSMCINNHIYPHKEIHRQPVDTHWYMLRTQAYTCHVHIHIWPTIFLYTGMHVSKHTSALIHMHRGYFDNTVNSSSSQRCGNSYNEIQQLSLNFSEISSCTGTLSLNLLKSIKTIL